MPFRCCYTVQFYVQVVVLVRQVAANTAQCSVPDAISQVITTQVAETMPESVTWSYFLQ